MKPFVKSISLILACIMLLSSLASCTTGTQNTPATDTQTQIGTGTQTSGITDILTDSDTSTTIDLTQQATDTSTNTDASIESTDIPT